MAQGYTRNDTSNNIATGNIINATDLDGEFDALQSAFDATSGHNHDGTVGGGSPISTLGPTQEIVVTTTAIRPSADNTIDLGTSTLEFKDLYIDGTANIDSLVADTADINGGTIDNATIATSNITVGAGKTLDVSAGTLTLANDQISGDKVEGGTIAATTITTLTSTTVNATTVDTTNLEVTTLKAKDGTTAGTVANTTGVVTITSLVATTADVNGGTVDGTTIGASVPAAGTFTTATATTGNITTVNATTVDTTNLEVTTLKAKDGTAAGSIADATGVVTLASSVLTTTDINGGTIDGTTIGGSAAAAGTFTTVTASGDLTIADKIVHSGDTDTSIRFPAADTVTVETGGAERLRITSSGNVGIGVVPSAWASGNFVGLQVGSGASIAGRYVAGTEDQIYISTNAYNDGAWKYLATGAATSYYQDDGTHVWRRAASGTAGAAITWSENMRIDSSGNVGIGTSSPGQRLQVQGAAFADTVIRISTASGTTGNFKRLEFTDNAGGTVTGSITSFGSAQGAGNDSDMAFAVNGTERMRIDSSGNVGIGTSSPANKLDVRTGTTGNIAAFYGTSTYHLAIEEVGGVMFLDANNGSATIGFKTNDTERMRIDASGNLGLGVTPSAWTSSVKAAQLNTKAAIYGSSSATGLGFNVFNDGSNKYLTTDAATLYLLGAGSHAWYNAPSGTAGNAITFTQAMTLDASGNLDVGNSSTAVSSTTRTTSIKSSNIGNLVFGITQNAVTMGSSVTAADIYTTAALDMRFGTNNTERMRISSVGALGIGGANYGTSGQVLTSGGSGAAPSWADLSSSQVGSATAGLAYGAVGTYAFVYRSGTGVTEDTTYAGSALNIAGIHSGATSVTADSTGAADLTRGSATLSGTWRVMGRSNAGSTLTRARGFLALRIS